MADGSWVEDPQESDFWLPLCHADNRAPVPQVCLICGEHQIEGFRETWREVASSMAGSKAPRAQDGSTVLVHSLSGMFIRGAGAGYHHASGKVRILGNGCLEEHLSEG